MVSLHTSSSGLHLPMKVSHHRAQQGLLACDMAFRTQCAEAADYLLLLGSVELGDTDRFSMSSS